MTIGSKRRPYNPTSFALTVLVTCLALSARAQVLDQVPADALVVVKVTNLKAASDKIGKFMQDLGLAQMAPAVADPLKAMQDQLKIQNGLDQAGDMAFCFIDPDKTGGRPDESMVILFPTSDYKAFMGNFPDAKDAEGAAGVSEVTMGDSGKPGFVASWGKYAAVSPNKTIAAMKPQGLKVQGAASAKEMTSKDVVFYANMAALRTKLQPQLAENRTKILDEVDKNLAKSTDPNMAKMAPVAKAVVTQLLNGADSFLRDASSASFSINFTNDGLATSLMAEFQPTSYFGSTVSSLKASNAPLTAGLPQGKYLMYGGMQIDPKSMTKIFDDASAPVVAELKNVAGDQGAAISKYVDSCRKMIAAMKTQTMGFVAPGGTPGQEPVIQFATIATGDAATLKSLQKDMVESQQAIAKSFGQNAPAATFAANAKTAGDVTFDQITVPVPTGDPNDPQAAQAQKAMQIMYGPNGLQMLTGTVGDKLVVASGVSDEFLNTLVTSAKANQDVLSTSDKVKAVTANLPKNRVAVVYVPLDEIVSTIGNYANANGMNFNVQLPPDLPPIGAAVTTEGSALRVDSYTPTTLVQSIVAAGMQVFMQMQGGRQPGGPGGL